MSESSLVQLGRLWVIENYPYNSTHLLKSLEWLDRIAPDASEAVRLATLTHDMERAFGGPGAIPIMMNDRAYEKAHSDRSARIVGEWLLANGGDAGARRGSRGADSRARMGRMARRQSRAGGRQPEFSRDEHRSDDGFVKSGKYSLADIASKIDEMYERIQVRAGQRAGAADVGAGKGAVGV